MKTFRADLHVHTVLSPCAELEMQPPLIIYRAKQLGINLIAITDHNASANIKAVQQAAQIYGITVLPGMELQTKEEVHALCLFDTLEQIDQFQKFVDDKLPKILNNPDYFGEQLVVDQNGDYIRKEDQLLITSTAISLQEAFEEVEKRNGLFIPAHVNRKANGLLEILGFVPPDIPFLALEISRHISPRQARKQFPALQNQVLIQNGDVHRLDEFTGSTIFEIKEPTIDEIKLALQNKNGRSFKVEEVEKNYYTF